MARDFDEIGERYPAIELYDEAQGRADLLSLAGGAEWLVISYCAIWCDPCEAFALDLPGIAATLGGEVAFVEVVMQRFSGIPSTDPADAGDWAALHGLGPAGPARVLTTGDDRDAYDLLDDGAQIRSFPTYHVVRVEGGRLAGVQTGYGEASGFVDFVQGAIAAYRPPAASVVESGGAAADLLEGASGDDTLAGLGGDDSLVGGRGYDVLRGGAGADQVRGGRQGDVIGGGRGDDDLRGQNGNDTIRGGLGDDLLFGGTGDDLLFGRDGDDRLRGGDDDDVLRGGVGRDTLDGGNGEDALFGGSGRDLLIVQERPDANGSFEASFAVAQLHGGAGADTFLLRRGGGEILDLEANDRIRIGREAAAIDFFEFAGDTNIVLLDADGETIGLFGVVGVTQAEVEARLLLPF